MAAQLTSLLSFSSSHALANYKGDTSCFKVLHSSSHSARRRNRRVFCSSAQAPARETQAHPLSIWLESRDVPTKRLGSQPKIVEGKLCLVATRPTSSGQTLAAIPQKAWLTQQTVSQSPIGIFVEELDGWLQICLFLLHERSKQQSAWGPYLASLPREVDLPLFWSETELQQLQGTQLQTSVEGYRCLPFPHGVQMSCCQAQACWAAKVSQTGLLPPILALSSCAKGLMAAAGGCSSRTAP